MHRRGFLIAAGGLAFAGAPPRAEVDSIATLSMRPEYYHGWPTIARRASGELLVVCSGGREQHVCPFGWVELMRSRDDGRTWSWPEVVMDSPLDDRDAGICVTARDSLLVTTFTSLAYQPVLERAIAGKEWPAERLRRWQAAHARIAPAERQAMLACWMLRSTDGGLTWSTPYRVSVNSPHGPVQLSDGRLLYAGKSLWDGTNRIGVCHSRDDGQTWQWLAAIPERPGDSRSDYHELHALDAGGGRLLVHLRNHSKPNTGETLQSESTDGGETWSTPHSIGVWGLPSHLLRLRDGRLLMSYGYRRAPFGNQARLSDDRGRTWSAPVTISSDGASGDLGYPSTVQLADSSLLTVWYELPRDSTKAILRQARWRVA
jgi:sialidase-1